MPIDVPVIHSRTIYSYIGDFFAWVLVVVSFIFIAILAMPNAMYRRYGDILFLVCKIDINKDEETYRSGDF